jgi:hypothetical protein
MYNKIEWPEELKLKDPQKTKWNPKHEIFEGGDWTYQSRAQKFSYIEPKYKVMRAIEQQRLYRSEHRRSDDKMYRTFVKRWYLLQGITNNDEVINDHINEYNSYCDSLKKPSRRIKMESPSWVKNRGQQEFHKRFFDVSE